LPRGRGRAARRHPTPRQRRYRRALRWRTGSEGRISAARASACRAEQAIDALGALLAAVADGMVQLAKDETDRRLEALARERGVSTILVPSA
jgi:hypothetical protein